MLVLLKPASKPILLFGVFLGCCYAMPLAQSMQLWYSSPAGETWENALPVGNGRLGAMIYGNVEKERIGLNEHTLWSGGPHRNDNLKARDSLALIRQYIFSGKYKEAERTANNAIISKGSHGQMFLPFGELQLNFPGHENYSAYKRILDIENGVSRVEYLSNNVQFTRTTIASLPEKIIAIHLSASRPGSINFEASLHPAIPGANRYVQRKELVVTGTGIDHEGIKGEIKYKGIARINAFGGHTEMTDTSIIIRKADSATIYVFIATNFSNYKTLSADEHQLVSKRLNAVQSTPFHVLLNKHKEAFSTFFNRVRINLGSGAYEDLPTDVRLKQFSTTNDPAFAALYYQYGRYLLISSSQAGGQPANLQGIWNNKLRPPWDSKYTININTEMNYWPAEKTGLPEMHEPLFKMVKELSVKGQATAKNMYSSRGWMAHHNTDLWRATGAVDGAFWGAWVNGGAWLSQHIWEHYLYTGDKSFLRNYYPVLKGAALFYGDFLMQHPKLPYLVIAPDESPENAPAAHQGVSLDAGTTMTNQIVFDALHTAIEAGKILKVDAALGDTLSALVKQLPPMQVGKHGQLQEWLDDVDDPDDKHRHISHLYGLYPSNQISLTTSPALFAAARKTLEQRGDISTGWSMGWKVNWWARLLDGEHAFQLIQNQLTPVGTNEGGGGTYNNLFDAHPPFQIDGNFGCTSGITEMLVQCSDGAVHLLPALPKAWSDSGSISGVRLRGGFEIKELRWKKGQVTRLVMLSKLGGNLRLRSAQSIKFQDKVLAAANGFNSNPFYRVRKLNGAPQDLEAIVAPSFFDYDFTTQPGKTYSFSF